ncbi:hypothetical protein A2348_00225 [Candidatus Uhrbacteria bacterium RIFOXYB12_FULL_58_10]|uniref:Uncharacterized protein n=1 Tax=Candidatus Uhrbacteria bacterium RIFOXYB2_FULL_57_15 TaxID=1802422 RepID=A0A1F7W777_9BACT|nr:MAG: hypothetical protein A2348_00225 [Candidatus Uhrbacteria bacterium RIFOXYB12_FULL_58_10]OGL98652.1 MAG: hypothetical protein A2304_03035 [Candidatus Uhrbacteria bacterium RIFOXYB2_FULL_57_15]OGM00001.1 MAG: hypothetical protein A2501_02680 [Candidatus Uhrbacteria bacterium RIFOXYC12_FULL_57_11]
MPRDVNPFFQAAADFVLAHQDIPLETAFLDEWNGLPESKTVRIIYAGPYTSDCGSRCDSCPLYRRVGTDAPGAPEATFATTLCEAQERHRALLGSDTQRFLNCKTRTQYQEAFVRFMTEMCRTREEMDAELLWVSGMRLLLYPGCATPESLLEREREIKFEIVAETLRRLDECGDDERSQWIKETRSRLFFPSE